MSCYEDLVPIDELQESFKGYKCTETVDMACPHGYDDICCVSCNRFYHDCDKACKRAEDWFIAKKPCKEAKR